MRNVQSNKGMALFLEVLLMWSRHQLAQESSRSVRARDRVLRPTHASACMVRSLQRDARELKRKNSEPML
jgi:hypothetical protein